MDDAVRRLEVELRRLHPGMTDGFYAALMTDADTASVDELEAADEMLRSLERQQPAR